MPESGWSADFATGSRQVDAANESLFFLIGNLFKPGVECKKREGFCPHDGCGKVMAIHRFVARNFAVQEKLMTETGYPGIEAHRRAHTDLLVRLRDLYDKQVCGDWEEEAVRSAVTRWAVEHVDSHDRPLGQWLGSPAACVERRPAVAIGRR